MNDTKHRRVAEGFSRTLERWGESITSAVGTMWTAIAFTLLALISLPGALASGNVVVIVAWIAQTFLQLVLLPIIMVGQNVQSRKTEKRDNETHAAVMAAHRETQEILRELHARDGK
ncbi:MAG: hypothetical protein RLZZ587_390 [Actinomycetota bacterium]